jgi:Fur family peroxide stress response transcriptional regulator
MSRLRAAGQRVTSQRLAILRVLLENGRHPSAEEILRRVVVDYPATSLGTVYSTLTLLAEMGEAAEILTRAGKRYDAHRPLFHPHLICAKCHEVSNFNVEILTPHAAVQAAVEEAGYCFIECRVQVFGLCPRCQEQELAPPAAASGLPVDHGALTVMS